VRTLEMVEPAGWIHLTLGKPAAAAEGAAGASAPPSGPPTGIRAYLVQLAVLTNHQNGRDTHVRQVRIYGPRKCVRLGCALLCAESSVLKRRTRRDMLQAAGHAALTSVEFSQYATIR
jgi:hypothetical protein